MMDSIKGMLDELPEDMAGEAAAPAANHLFEVNELSADMLLDDGKLICFITMSPNCCSSVDEPVQIFRPRLSS
jgi:hypothetical protein